MRYESLATARAAGLLEFGGHHHDKFVARTRSSRKEMIGEGRLKTPVAARHAGALQSADGSHKVKVTQFVYNGIR